jgi:polyphosphate kinase 2 (PPK2 family)
MDAEAQSRWKEFSAARDQMLVRTDTAVAPVTCIHTDDKKTARLNLLRTCCEHCAGTDRHAGRGTGAECGLCLRGRCGLKTVAGP